MKAKLILFPCGGNSIEALDCVDQSRYEVIGFVDDDASKVGTQVSGISVYDRSFFDQHPDAKVLAVPGSAAYYKKRKEIIDGLELSHDRFTSIIHPQASISADAKVGTNCLIMEGVALKHSSRIADHVCILPNSVVHHESSVGSYSMIGSGVIIAGRVLIGDYCYIGSKSSVINDIKIAKYTLIGMASNVIRSITEESKTYAGNPAKEL